MPSEKTPLRGEQFASDVQKRKRIIGLTGAIVVLAAVTLVLWLTFSGHNSKSTEVTASTSPEPSPALRTEDPAASANHDTAPFTKPEPPVQPVVPVPAAALQLSPALPVPAAIPQPVPVHLPAESAAIADP